jgi:DNA polymerase delta subunit 2
MVLDVMQASLEIRHVCPTAPDTLRAFPFVDNDPFVIESCPHVYFAGNQEDYAERLVTSGVTTCK